MKKIYEKPFIEIETYEMDGSIAAGCRVVVKMGPEHNEQKVCQDYFEHEYGDCSVRSTQKNIDFWDDTNCLCYYNASGAGIYFTS